MEVIAITGGSRGIGAAAARACADRGLGVILTYNSHPEAAEAVVTQIGQSGGRAVALPLDVADTGSFPSFQEAATRAGRDLERRQPARPRQQCRVRALEPDRDRHRGAIRRPVLGAP
jgi:NAD(P)-dependent dehydrogenase (short-subunit alcohol dehydrogenase family)